MSKYTKAERHEIYKKAIIENDFYWGMCNVLLNLGFGKLHEDRFPE